MAGKFIEIKVPRCKAYVTHEEAWQLLRTNPELHAVAINRGKAFGRAKMQRKREAEKLEKHYSKDPGMTGKWDD